MSVINKMLQELDRRNAAPGSEAEQAPQQVKAVAPVRTGHEWFWRIVAVLMLAAVGWVAWVAYQLQPAPQLATEQAFKAAAEAAKGKITAAKAPPSAPVPAAAPVPAPVPTPPVVATPAPATPAPAPVPAPAVPPPAAAPPASAPVVSATPAAPSTPSRETPDSLKMAQSIETPIPPRPQTPSLSKPEPKPEAPKVQASSSKVQEKAVSPPKSAVDKRDRTKPGSELAEAQFRRAALLLNQGRVSEAEEQLVGALQADPAHVPARQAYVALLLEQQRSDAARRVLGEALAVNPAQPTFALALARILAEQRDYPGALDVMDRAGSVGRNADFLALRGAVLQRMQRHREAIDAYEGSVKGAPQPGTTWVGYGISLEALGRRPEAAQAYRRSLGAGGLAREVREYAEARIRALE